MGSSNKTISYTIDIGADITKARQAAEQLQAIFKKSFGEGSNKGMFNLFSGLEKALDTLERKSSQKITSIADAKALEKAKQDVVDYFAAIEREGKKIGNLGGADFKKRLEGLGTQLADSAKAWKTFEDAQKSANKEAEKQSSDIQKKIDDNKKLIQSMRELKAVQDALGGKGGEVAVAKGKATRLETAYNSAKGVVSNKTRIANQAQRDYEDYIKQHNISLTESGGISTSTKSKAKMGYITDADLAVINQYLATVRKLDKEIAKLEKTKGYDQKVVDQKKAERDAAKSNFDNAIKSRGLSLTATGDIDKASIQQNRQAVEDQISEAQRLGQAWKDAAKDQQEAQKKMAEAQTQAKQAREEADTKEVTFKANADQYKTYNDQLKQNREAINQSREALRKFIDEASSSRFDQLKEALRGIFGDEFVADMENSEEGLEKLKGKLEAVGDEKMDEARARIQEFLNAFKESEPAGKSVKELGDKVNKAGQDVQQLTDRQRDVENFISRFKHFFSLTNGFMLLKRSIRDAINTIKELDAVMTQTAVVSENTVGDMWKTLPEYSEEAKKLGAAIKDVYSAQTLYVQQGLDMNSAMDLGVETLKMARVAGIDAAAATDTMTAALRGFKMELNETSAVRINDVYSKLAQNSASNVQEISTAMSKVAALANSANMSFENTAGFLAKIIESTREGAETAGTALKTVIARFTEVKKLYSEGELTGTDEEGQEVDVNKISAALRTAGINMNDFFTGAKGLDEIFMELGSKWDSLTTVQQRYIATMAAGSRQQSRFLALMQDYSRTVELTNMAYNSAGSGQEQFEKTLDSLESKLNQLKAAWDTFTMGIANSDFIKGVIDVGTKLLETINKIIDAVSGGNRAIKSILSLGTAFTGFKLGGALLKGGLGKIGTIIGMRAGADAGKGFITTFMTSVKAAQYGTKLSTAGDLLGRSLTRQFAPTLKQATSYLYNDFWKTVNIQETFKGKDDLFKQFQEGFNTKDIDKMNKALKEAGSEAQITQDQMNALSAANKGLQLNFNAVANSALMFGGALVALGTYLESVGGHTGEVGTVVKKVGISLLACGAAFKVAAVAAQAFGTSLYEIPYIGWIAAAITVIVAAITAWAAATENATEKAERLKKAAEETAEGVKKVKSDYEDLMSKIDSINKAESGLDELTTGTEEWDTAVQNLNQSILELIKLYPGLAEAVTYTNGRLGLDMTSEAYKNYVKDYKAKIANGIYGDFSGSLGVQYNDYEQAADKDGYGYLNGKETLGVLFNSNSLKEAAHFWAESLSDGLYGADVERMKTLINGGYFDQMYDLLDLAVKSGYVTDTRIGVGWEEFDQWLVDSGLNDKYGNYFDKEITINYDYGPKENPGNVTETKTLWDFFGHHMFGSGSGLIYWEDYIKAMNAGLKYNEGVNTLSTFAAANVMDTAGLSGSKYSSILYQLARQLYKNNYDVESVDTSNLDLVKFAESIGGKYESGEVYTSEGTKVTENAKFWQAGKNAEAKAAVQLSSINSKIGRLSPDEISMLLGLVEDRKNLTLEQIEKLRNNQVKGIGDFSLEEIAGFAGIKETHDKTASQLLLKDVDKVYSEIFSPLEGFKNKYNIEEAIKNTNFQTVAQANNLAQQAANVQMRGGNSIDFIKTLSDLEQDLEKRISPDKLEQVKNIIASTDFSDSTSIKNTIKSLNELGASIGEDFTKQIINASNAVSKFTTKNLEEQITSLEEGTTAAEKINNGEKVLNNKEYENLANILRAQNPEEWDSKWVRTGIDEWTYIGEETNSILSNIDAAVSTLVSESLGQAKEDVQKGEEIKQKISNNKTLTAEYYDEDGEVFDTKQFNTQEFFESLYDSGNYVDLPQLRAAANLLGVDISNYDTHTTEGLDLARQAVFDYYDTYYGSNGGSLIANQEKVAGLTAYSDILPYKYTNAQSVINDQNLTPEKQTEVLETGVKKLGAGEEYMVEKSMESALPATKAIVENGQITGWEEDTDIDAQTKKLKDYKDVLNALAIDSNKTAKKFDNLTQSYKDNADALTDDKKGTREYGIALGNFTKSVKAAYNNNDVITEEFVGEHLNLFKDLSEGVEGSAEAVTQAIADEMIKTGQDADLVNTALQALDGAEFDINGNADFSNVFNQFAATEEQANALAEVLRSLGYTVDLKMGEPVIDPASGQIIGYNWEAVVNNSGQQSEIRNRGGGGGGGGGGKEFKNDFDKYYNMVEDINELTRLRNLLETDYQQLLDSEAASGKAIYDNLKKQVDLLKERRDITADLAEKRKQQILDEMAKSENADLSEYAWWNNEDQTIEINWDAINEIKDSELGDRVKEFVSTLEGFQSKYDEQIEALEDIESTLQEIEKRGRDQYTSLEDRVRDALIQQIQTQIDELTAVNEGISEANQKLFDSIQNTLELQRQERDNAKTEEELSDKEQRLTYLQQDSSGANALEIAQLQEELADARESYTDQLIDQKISELQKQNDEAAEQRQEQIDLLQQSLDWQEKNGEFWEQAYQLMNNGIGPDGTLVTGSELEQLLKQGEGWQALSQEGKMNWLSELETMVAEAVGYLYLSRQLEKIGTKAGTEITFTDAEGNTHTGKVDKNGNVVIDNGDGTQTVWKDVYQSYDGSYRTLETEKDAKTENKPATSTGSGGTGGSGGNKDSGGSKDPGGSKGTGKDWSIKKSGSQWIVQNTPNSGQYATEKEAKDEAYSKNKLENIWGTKLINGRYSPYLGGGSLTFSEANSIASDLNAGKNVITPYATGGLNTKTGPAWLDGTPSHPELVLNARDTENFIQLKDTLADLKKYGTSLGLNGGDNYYDIDVHVDEIGSDYDVDKLADRLKTLIYRDGQYRNVNILNRLR